MLKKQLKRFPFIGFVWKGALGNLDGLAFTAFLKPKIVWESGWVGLYSVSKAQDRLETRMSWPLQRF